MNSILNDPLVRRYFGCKTCVGCQGDGVCNAMALDVLDAMTAKLKVNEKYLYIGNIERGALVEVLTWSDVNDLHPSYLRLPDSFQEPDYEKELEDLRQRIGIIDETQLSNLVDLARKAERQKMEREKR